MLGLGIGLGITRATRVPASAYASSLAPAGYRWDFVTINGQIIAYANEPVVALVSN